MTQTILIGSKSIQAAITINNVKHSKAKKSSAYLEITEINPNSINQEWLSLLVGLKGVHPGTNADNYYKDVSLYECLLAQLNGKTAFKSKADDTFMFYSHASPTHTWIVIEQSLKYLLQHFLGEAYYKIYQHLTIHFKLFLLEQTFEAYQDKNNQQIQQCHYLLQEMCQYISQQVLEINNQTYIALFSTRIKEVQEVIAQRLSQQHHDAQEKCRLDIPQIVSLSFSSPNVKNYDHYSGDLKTLGLQVDTITE